MLFRIILHDLLFEINGRVKNSFGQGIPRTVISLSDSNGNVQSAITNPFGYYKFTGLTAGEIYTVTASSKQYQFQNNPRVVTVLEDLLNEDFIGDANSFYKRE